jgi:hypothetical protein
MGLDGDPDCGGSLDWQFLDEVAADFLREQLQNCEENSVQQKGNFCDVLSL